MSYDPLDLVPDRVLANRYRWFCRTGWKQPVLNKPQVIRGEARPCDIDQFIAEGMTRWPSPTLPTPVPPESIGRVA